MSLQKHTIQSLLKSYNEKKTKPSEVIGEALARIEKLDGTLHSLLEVQKEKVLSRAAELDAEISKCSSLPLYGVPVAIKDNFLVSGWQATAGSKILENYISPYTATSVKRLEDAGAIVIGKANCDEFAMGSSNEHSAYGPTKNPWDTSRVPGGSSGGSAVAVAASFALGSLGSDTGGSVRQPASLCGVVGLKPTYGRISRYGVIAYASSLDQVGPFAKTSWDTARLLEVMSGFDLKDSTSSKSSVPQYTEQFKSGFLKGLKVGIWKKAELSLDADVLKAYHETILFLKKAGAVVSEIELGHIDYALATYYIIAPCEASSNLARYDGVHYGYREKDIKTLEELYSKSRGRGFGQEVKLRIMLGTYALSHGYFDAYYIKANQVRELIKKDFLDAFHQVDVVLTPTSPSTAFKFGEKSDDPLKMYLSDIFTLPVNLAGLPGLSFPVGLDENRLPIGMQVIGKSMQ